MPLTAGGPAPYTPPASVVEILSRYRDRGLATPITTEVIERAGVPETLSGRTLQALKLLEFVDAEGQPSPEFDAISRAPESEYKERLGEFVAGMYGEVLNFADPATDSYDRVRDAFRGFNPKGQQERMVTLFLGLLEYVGHDISAAASSRRRGEATAKKTTPRSAPPRNGKATPAKRFSSSKTRVGEREKTKANDLDQAGLPPGLVGLLQQIPRDGKPWTTARRDAFMTAFEAVLDFTIPIGNEPVVSEPQEDSS